MHRFWYITVFFGLVELCCLYLGFSWIWPLLAWLVFLVWASASVCSGIYLPAFCRGTRGSGNIALTFDDGPDPENLPAILDLLESFGFRATFFFVGSRVEGIRDLVGEVQGRGHQVGNHSWSHNWSFPLKSGARIADELVRCTGLLEEAGTAEVSWFRPPFGVSNPRIYRGWKASGLKVAGWSIRSFDSRGEKASLVVRRIVRRLRGGDVVLLHENSPHILEILGLLLPVLVEKGLSGLTLEELHQASS